MSFRVTFDGSLTGRTDVPEMTATSNLTGSVAGGKEFSSDPRSFSGFLYDIGSSLYYWSKNGNTITVQWAGATIFTVDVGGIAANTDRLQYGGFVYERGTFQGNAFGTDFYSIQRISNDEFGTVVEESGVVRPPAGPTAFGGGLAGYFVQNPPFRRVALGAIETYSGGSIQMSGPVGSSGNAVKFILWTPLLTGSYTIQTRFRLTGAFITRNVYGRVFNSNSSSYYTAAQWLSIQPGSGWITWNQTLTLSNETVTLHSVIPNDTEATTFDIDYFRVVQNNIPINVTTITNGVAATGGTPTTATPSTVIDGAAGTAAPAKEFGVEVNHDGSKIMDAKYQPPADNTQNAEMALSKTKIITATATDISVEGKQLDATDKLAAADTTLTVKEYIDATEN